MGDLILGLILLIAVLDGYRRGVIKILGSFGGVFVGIFVARQATPVLLPLVAEKLNLALYGSDISSESTLVASWFFTNTVLGRLLELVLFVVITAAVTWLVRFLVSGFGSVVNHTPLIGYVSRVLGACLELFVYAVVLYFLYVWFLPWLEGIIPQVGMVTAIFTSSQYVLNVILDIGGLVWHTAVAAVLNA
jgi:uncharacterized membrane protein required for colicin V production